MGFFFVVWALKTAREDRVRWSERRDGWKDGGSNSTETTGALNTLALDTRTNTHKPSGDSNLRAIFRPDDWQLDAYSSPTRPADNSSYPIPCLSSLVLHSHHLFSSFFLLLWLSQHPHPLTTSFSPLLSFFPSFFPLLCLSLWACCGAITMTEAIRDIYHMCGGVSERKPSTGLGGGTHKHTHTNVPTRSIETYRNAHTLHARKCASTRAHKHRQINKQSEVAHACTQMHKLTHTHTSTHSVTANHPFPHFVFCSWLRPIPHNSIQLKNETPVNRYSDFTDPRLSS